MIRDLGAEFRLGKRLGRDFTLGRAPAGTSTPYSSRSARRARAAWAAPAKNWPRRRWSSSRSSPMARRPAVGSDVIIVGGGNTAMDACRCAVRLGRQVRARALPPHPPRDALPHGGSGSGRGRGREDRVPGRARCGWSARTGSWSSPASEWNWGRRMKAARPRPVPVPGSEFEVQATCVIAAIGQSVDSQPLNNARAHSLQMGHRR